MPTHPPLGFVHSSNGNISAESRRFVRSHAAVGGWVAVYNASRRDQPRSHRLTTPLAGSVALDYDNAVAVTVDDFTSDVWADHDSLHMLYQHVGDPQTLAQSKVDPFDTLPIPHNPFVNMLLFHFFKRWIIHAPELDPPAAPKAYTAKNWHMIRKSPLALTAHLLLCAGIIYLLRGVSSDRPSLLHLKHIALRLVNEAIEMDCFEDEVLLSILALCNYESIMGGRQELQAHMRGLKQIVAIRGGLDSLCPSTRNMLIFSDKSIAFMAQNQRLFPQHSGDEDHCNIAKPEIDPSMRLQHGFEPLVHIGAIHQDLALPLLHFQALFERLCNARGSRQWNSVVSRDEWIATERILDVVPLTSHIMQLATFEPSKPYDIGECIRLSALLLCYYLKQWSVHDFRSNEKLVAQIVSSLVNHAYEVIRRPTSEELLSMEEAKALWWISCIIGCTTSSKNRRLFAILSALRVKLQIMTAEAGVAVLEDFLFDHHLFKQQYTRLWTWMTSSRSRTVTVGKGPENDMSKSGKATSSKLKQESVKRQASST